MALFHGKTGKLFLNVKKAFANSVRVCLFIEVAKLILHKVASFTEWEFYDG